MPFSLGRINPQLTNFLFLPIGMGFIPGHACGGTAAGSDQAKYWTGQQNILIRDCS